MVRQSVLKKVAIVAILPLALMLSSCSNDVESKSSGTGNQVENQSANSSKIEKSVSAIGTWGPEKGSESWSTDPWISFTKDKNFTASDSGVSNGMIVGTWSQNGKNVDLIVLGQYGTNSKVESKISSADKAEITEDTIEIYSVRGTKLASIPFSTEDPLLSKSEIGDAAMDRGAEIAKMIEGQNSSSSSATNSSATKSLSKDTAYTNRFGK